jgi:S-adenosylmethionine:tRNA ribosyltransferase-isomerase
MLLRDFHYELPDALIARHPTAQRSASRLLHLVGQSGAWLDRRFVDLPSLLQEGDLLVFNDTKVIPARLFGTKATGGRVELMLERLLPDGAAQVQLRASKPVRAGQQIMVADGLAATVRGRDGDFWVVDFPQPASEVFERYGEMPLPPYMNRRPDVADNERYQTVYARVPGAVAAPTAGLHFDVDLLTACRDRGVRFAHVTLHVGAGTFQPVRVDDVREHRMHSEWLQVGEETVTEVAEARRRGGRVVAVGTTAVRALETAAQSGALRPYQGETRLFLTPGCCFQVVDALITNFHLPESTLLMLVCAFAGRESVLAAYAHAVATGYRFFSYGDAMFIEPAAAALRARRT